VIQGDSAIPGSRATRATTLTKTRDCDGPIDERKGLPTVQMLSAAVKQVRRREERVTVKPHTTRQPKQQEDQKGIRGEGVVVASLSWTEEQSEEGRGGGC